MNDSQWFLLYWKDDINPKFGKSKGFIASVSRKLHTGRRELSPEFGHTVMPHDIELLDKLLTGHAVVDIEKTEPNNLVIKKESNPIRIKAVDFIRLQKSEWVTSPGYQEPAHEKIYKRYAKVFLEEFTKRTRHIPPRRQFELYPNSLILPTDVKIYVARDAMAIVYDAPIRPESFEVIIDTDSILDSLILPHPKGKRYLTDGPDNAITAICNDDFYKYIRGVDTGIYYRSFLGNPRLIVVERKYHCFWDNIGFERVYNDGTVVSRMFQFAEIFGDITRDNFTEQRARDRAHKYAIQWAINRIKGVNPYTPLTKPIELRLIIDDFRKIINDADLTEPEIEKFMDRHSWILERGLGYKRYFSQIQLDKSIFYMSDSGVKPDKLLERHDGFCDVFDLKRPDTPIVVKKRNRTHASYLLTESEAQIDNYISLLKQPKAREFLLNKGIKISSPKGILLVGRRPVFDMEGWEHIKQRLCIEVLTYDDLLEEIESVVRWVDQIGGA